MSLRFVPPKEDRPLPRYASYGSGQMRTHRTTGAAKQSLANRCLSWADGYKWKHGFILELVDNEWFVLHEVPEGTALGEEPWKKPIVVDYQYGTRWNAPYDPDNKYQKEKLASGKARLEKIAKPMTRDEYAEWRLKVELERRGIDIAE